MQRSIVVVGGGVVGLSCAYHLRRQGCAVTVLDSGEIGAGASWGNAGWVCPVLSAPVPGPGVVSFALRSLLTPGSPLRIAPQMAVSLAPWLWRFWRSSDALTHRGGMLATAALAQMAMADFDQLRDDGVDVEMRSDGLLFAFLDADHARQELAALQPLREAGQRLPESVTLRAQVRGVEPALSDAVAATFVAEDERHVVPHTLTAGLAARLDGMGACIKGSAPVLGIARNATHWTVQTPAERICADDVVVAAGAWSTSLLRPLGVRLPMVSGKGYSFSIAPPAVPHRPLYLAEAKVGCTPMGDQVRLAGTMELAGLDTRLRRHRIDAIARSAQRYLGEAALSARRQEWAGLRPMLPDGLPVIGPAGPDGLWVASGHAMLGVTLGPTTGRVLAEQMDGRRSPVLDAFSVRRFAGRNGVARAA